MAHMALQELVERAVEEARKLPGLGGSCEVTEQPTDQEKRQSIKEHDYEDLLATAILNKVIEKFQNEKVDNNSNILHGIRAKSTLNENEFSVYDGLDECSSSLEPLSQDDCSSDCSVSRSKYFRSHREPLSLTIEEQIEEVTTTYTSDEEFPNENNQLFNIGRSRRVPFPEFGMDIVDPSQESSDEESGEENLDSRSSRMMDLITPSESWEENWLFQRKKSGVKADSVAMLVPHPSAEFKAMIGDKDAEDTSDLSECSVQSDEEIEKELIEVIQNVVPRVSKEENVILDEEVKVPEEEKVEDGQYRAIPMYIISNEEENVMDKSTRSLEKFIIDERRDSIDNVTISVQTTKTNTDERDTLNLLTAPPRPGTIAEREHKKWENAAPIENNPYSEQSIQKRLLERQYRRSSDMPSVHQESNEIGDIILESNKPDIRRFSRDYYINNNNNTKLTSGQRGTTLSVSSSSCSSISRPSSSLSQESTSDIERQERTRTRDWSQNNNNKMEINEKIDDEKLTNNGEEEPRIVVDYLFENERRNQKNVINAKLNNRDVLFDNNNIKRLDLKSYGFENEFNMKNPNVKIKSSQQRRTINKLDLKSFGYENGLHLRRTRSVNHLDFDTSNREDLIKKSSVKSNYINKTNNESCSLKSVKSVPDITCLELDYHCESDTENYIKEKFEFVSRNLPLPSVRKLAEAFGKTSDVVPVPSPRISKSSNKIIRIIETPRQMHSLTARSLSKQFREGLRQLSTNKVPSSITKTSHNTENKNPTDNGTSDVDVVILPGKLKSNIKFWEQMQNKI